MGQQIIQQPNGRYALFSSFSDDFVLVNATQEELVEYCVDHEKREITQRVKEVLEKLAAGKAPYYQFTMGWEKALNWVAEVHGEQRRQKIIEDICPQDSYDQEGSHEPK